MIPADAAIRVVGDVHGDRRGFSHALATDRFVVQLGDLTDSGPDSGGVLRLALDMRREGRGLFLLGNHDLKLLRVLRGRRVRVGAELQGTLAQMDDGLRAEALPALAAAPAWLRHGRRLFVHGAFHPAMLDEPPPPPPDTHAEGPLARAMYGQTSGRMQADGYPERLLAWVDDIPAGLTVYCGHDRRSTDGRPYVRHGAGGGRAVFMDTGAGKGGHLSWIDLPAEEPR